MKMEMMGIQALKKSPKVEITTTRNPEAVSFTIHYSDGSSKTIESGLLATWKPTGEVEVECLNTSASDYLMVLAALEQSLDKVIELR